MYHGNQPNKSKLVLCKPLIHCNSHLKQLWLSNKMEASVIKVGMVESTHAYCAV